MQTAAILQYCFVMHQEIDRIWVVAGQPTVSTDVQDTDNGISQREKSEKQYYTQKKEVQIYKYELTSGDLEG